jgi:hypothetical protein
LKIDIRLIRQGGTMHTLGEKILVVGAAALTAPFVILFIKNWCLGRRRKGE